MGMRESGAGSSGNDELARLRQLLLGSEIDGLEALETRFAEYRPNAAEVAPALPEALELARKSNAAELNRATWPLIAHGLERSLKENPQRVVDILFPIIGPLIRRAITESLKDFTESLNQVLEQSLSPRYLGWRIQAWRTGVSVSEIVMRNTLLYSVEQVFLIQRSSGLMIAHVQRANAQGADSDAVSAMLNAIQDFVRDSFSDTGDSQLGEIEVGEFQVQIEHGPSAMLALAIRGVPRVEIRTRAREALERIHGEHALALSTFAGDGTALAGVEDQLRALLAQEQRAPPKAPSMLRPGSAVISAALLLGLGLGVWLMSVLMARSNFLEALDQAPGLVVAQRSGGTVSVLRDPDAATLKSFGDAHGLDLRERSIRSLEAPIVVARARRVLNLPGSVVARLKGSTLELVGTLDRPNSAKFRRQALAIDGVERLNFSKLSAPDSPQEWAELRTQVEAMFVQFLDDVQATDDARSQLDTLAAKVQSMSDKRRAATVLRIIGSTDGTGLEAKNLALGMQRAAWVRDGLLARGIDPNWMEIGGITSAPNAMPDLTRRRVSFSLIIRSR